MGSMRVAVGGLGMLCAAAAVVLLRGAVAAADPYDGLSVYHTPYYELHTDLDRPDALEAVIRMTRMVEEYHHRTRDFSGALPQPLPFYLFRTQGEYLAAGGPSGSCGVFTGKALLAAGGSHAGGWTWHVIQHEGFHQFAHAVIGGEIPTWLNEGMAEYFGYGVFTGDSIVTGVIPEAKFKQVLQDMERSPDSGGFVPIRQLMLMSHRQWNEQMSAVNYDQAWSMVQFLAHAENGRYQSVLVGMMQELKNGGDWEHGYLSEFGSAGGFENCWRKYWQGLPDHPTDLLYAQASVSAITSFVGRCDEADQKFDNFWRFAQAAEEGGLRIPNDDWLPPSVLQSAMDDANDRMSQGAKFSLSETSSGRQQVVCLLADRTQLLGTYQIHHGHVVHVTVDIVRPNAGERKRLPRLLEPGSN